jgi:hypothetical protein
MWMKNFDGHIAILRKHCLWVLRHKVFQLLDDFLILVSMFFSTMYGILDESMLQFIDNSVIISLIILLLFKTFTLTPSKDEERY